jgi:predicted alpha/beta superfamily hydrolase
MKISKFLITVILLFLQDKVAGQELRPSLENTSAPLNYAQQDIIHSEILGKKRKFNIHLPESFHKASNEHTYPVLILLEDEFFYMVSGVVKHLSSVERMPETIVVSILEMSYMPTVYTNGSTFWPMKQLSDENPDPFTKHLKEELFPYLKATYRANDFRMIMGLSSTSIYTFHTFVKEPDLFDAHIAIAAGDILGMGYKEGETLIDLVSDEVKNTPNKKRYLYVTSPDSDGGDGSPEIKENIEELNGILSTYRSEKFKFISRIFPNEGHYDVALPALLEALDLIFPKHDWSARYRDIVGTSGDAMKDIDTYYQELSAKYGFTILPRAERWNSVNRLSWIGPYLLRQGRIQEGIEIIERWTAYRPKSPSALEELAKAYETANELEKALSTITMAYDLLKDLGIQNSQHYLQLEELKVKIEGNK